jgi:hypothetical protein
MLGMSSDVRMTAAGLASISICRAALALSPSSLAARKVTKSLTKGWKYLRQHLTDKFLQKTPENANSSYTGFCIQQLAFVTGRRLIGGIDWFHVVASELTVYSGSGRNYARHAYWGPLIRAAFELLLLKRMANVPAIWAKLDYDPLGTSGNCYPQSLNNLCGYIKWMLEREVRWQILPVDGSASLWATYPIMLISGRDEMKLDEKQWGRLKEYTLRGGTLLFMPVRKGEEFLKSVTAKLKTLYAKQHAQAGAHYELEKLPDSHPLYSIYKKLRNGSKKFPLWGLSDGTRLLAVLSEKDAARSWQGRKEVLGRRDYILGVNFFLYATGQNDLSTRMRPVFTTNGKALPVRHTVKIGWVKHDGNWNSQPYALNYLAKKLAVENQLAAKITPAVSLGGGKLGQFDLLWMTGSDSFTLSEAQVAALREYLYTGGTLMINAVGGAGRFQRSASKMLEQLFADDEDISDSLSPSDSPLMTGKCGAYRGPRLKRLARTRAFVRTHPRAVEPVMEYRNAAGRILVAYLRFGVHDTLDGHTAYDAKSYMPSAAGDIASNIVLYAKISRATPAELKQYKKKKLRAKQAKIPTPQTQPGPRARGEKSPTPGQAGGKGNKAKGGKKKSSFLDDDDL